MKNKKTEIAVIVPPHRIVDQPIVNGKPVCFHCGVEEDIRYGVCFKCADKTVTDGYIVRHLDNPDDIRKVGAQ